MTASWLTRRLPAGNDLWLNAGQMPALDLRFGNRTIIDVVSGITPTYTRPSSVKLAWAGSQYASYAADVPAFQLDPTTGRWGYLHEPAATNLAFYNGAVVSGTGWLATNVTSATSGTGLDGSPAYEITETAATAAHNVLNTGSVTGSGGTSVTSGTTYTGSVFLKRSTVDWVQLTFGSTGFGASQYANFNLANGAVGNSAGLASGTTPRIQAFENGWYRCSISVTANSTSSVSNNLCVVFTGNADTASRLPSYTGSTSNKVLVSMLQFETGPAATSPIVTTGSTVTRAADTLTISGTDFSKFYNQAGGVCYIEASRRGVRSSAYPVLFRISDGGASNVAIEIYQVDYDSRYALTVKNAGAEQISFLPSAQIQQGAVAKVATRVFANDTLTALNGTVFETDTSVSLPVGMTTLSIGASPIGELIIYRFAYFPPGPAANNIQRMTA